MQCYVYKSHCKSDYFLYLPNTLENSQQALPSNLVSLLGELHFVVDFTLHAQRTLANADPKQVMCQIKEQGYYLQFAQKNTTLEQLLAG